MKCLEDESWHKKLVSLAMSSSTDTVQHFRSSKSAKTLKTNFKITVFLCDVLGVHNPVGTE